jgi:hypothetical protein
MCEVSVPDHRVNADGSAESRETHNDDDLHETPGQWRVPGKEQDNDSGGEKAASETSTIVSDYWHEVSGNIL